MKDRSAVRHHRARALSVSLIVALGAVGTGFAVAQDNAAGVDFAAVAGEEIETRVATFTDFEAGAEEFTATIDWGDGGAPSPGTVLEVEPCAYPDATCFEVRSTHTYSAEGAFGVVVTIRHGPDDPEPTVVRATATVAAAPETPTARIALVDAEVRPGEPAIVDASGSEGEISLYEFDLNGDGTFETKTTHPYASVVRTDAGTHPIRVKVTSADGATGSAATTLVVTGDPLPPPPGEKPFEQGTVVGSVHGSAGEAASEAAIKAYTCPVTVQVGVAEATMAPTWAGEPCFERKSTPNPGKPSLKHPAYPQFVATPQTINMALVNGLHIAGGRLVISEGMKWIEARTGPNLAKQAKVAMQIAKPPGYGGAFNPNWELGRWDVSKPGVVTTYPYRLRNDLLGLPVAQKSTPIRFTAGHQAEFEQFVLLPFSEFTLWPKNPPTGKPFTIRADNTFGEVAKGSYSYSFDLPLGIFNLEGTVVYSLEGGSHVWSGDIELRIPSSPVDIDGHLRIRDGEFEQASVDVPFKRPGLGPIGCCIYLIHLSGELTEHAIEAAATFAAGPTLIGDFRAAEATATVNWKFSPFMLGFKADDLKIAKWSVNANTNAVITNSFFLAFAFWDDSFGPFSHKVNVEVRIGKPWYVAGGGSACFEVWIEGCATVNAAAGPQGIAACGTVLKVLTGGVRVPWNPLNFSDWHGWWGCSFGEVKSKVSAAEAAMARARARAAGVAAAAATYKLRLPRRLRGALLAIEGRGSQPQVAVRRPRGPRIVTPAPDETVTRGKGWVATRDTNDDTTYVVVRKPAAGRWRVRALAGSPGIRSIGIARALPRRFARGRVTGKGRTRVLRYRVARAAGTKVTFVERGGTRELADPEQVVDQSIGRARKAKGKIRFIPGDARLRPRRIEAVVSSQGTVIKTEVVDRFRAPRFRLPSRPRVSLRRAGNALVIRWTKVAGARSYQAFLNQDDGETRYVTRPAGGRSARIRGIGGATSATAEVRALSPAGYVGRSGFGRLRALPAVQLDRRQAIGAALRTGGITARCTAAADGRCELVARKGARTLATGTRTVGYGETKRVRVRLTARGRKALRKAKRAGRKVRPRVLATVPGRVTTSVPVTLR